MTKISQSIPYPEYTEAGRNGLSGVLAGYKIKNTTSGSMEMWNGSEWKVIYPDAADTTPEGHGTAAVGASAKYARADHVHSSDNTNTMREAATEVPEDHGAANVGNSDKYARENHVHNSEAIKAYATLTANANATLDCSNHRDGVKATWAINGDYSLTITNAVNGQAADVVIDVTGEREVTIIVADTTKKYQEGDFNFVDDKVTLPEGCYHLCFTAGSNWVHFNIAKYGRVTSP